MVKKMDKRSQAILEAVIHDYINTASPVGSFNLKENYDFPFSSATIRSILADLDDLGYIFQPHTSAGRVPTEKGYRFFVDNIEVLTEFSDREESALRKKILSFKTSFEKMLDASVKIISEMTQNAGIAGANGATFKYGISNLLKKPELKKEDYAVGVSEIFDNIGEVIKEVPRDIGVEVFVGSENPIGKKAGCSLIVSRFLTPYGTRGFLGILGPTRMSYEKNMSVVRLVKDILEGVS